MSEITEERKEEIRRRLDELESERQALENELWDAEPSLRVYNLGFGASATNALIRSGITTLDSLLLELDKAYYGGKPVLLVHGRGIGPIRYNHILNRLKELGYLDSSYPTYP